GQAGSGAGCVQPGGAAVGARDATAALRGDGPDADAGVDGADSARGTRAGAEILCRSFARPGSNRPSVSGEGSVSPLRQCRGVGGRFWTILARRAGRSATRDPRGTGTEVGPTKSNGSIAPDDHTG